MKSGDILLKLIHSLTPSEKGYFKRQASLNRKDSKQLRLFDFLCHQQVYDTKLIVRKFEKEDFVKNLRIINKALNEAILKSMRAYHSQKSVQRILPNLLLDIEFAFKKELYDTCDELVSKGLDLSISHEFPKYTLLFRHWKSRIRKRTLRDYQMNVEALDKEKTDYLYDIQQIENEIHLFFWESKLIGLTKGLNNPLVQEELNESIHEKEVLDFKEKDMSVMTKFRYFNVCGLYYFYVKNDNEKAYEYYKNGLAHLDSQENATVNVMENHANVLITLMSNATYSNKYNDFYKFREELENLSEKYAYLKKRETSKVKVDFIIPIINLMFYNHFGELKKGAEIVETFKKKKAKYFSGHYFNFLKYYMVAYHEFLKGNTDDAFAELSTLLMVPSKETNERIAYHSKVLTLVLHWELDNHKYLPNMLRSFTRYLHKHQRTFEFERLFLRCFRAKVKYRTKSELKKEMQEIHKELLLNKEELIKELPYFDLIAWIQSKIENRPIYEILQEQERI